MASRLAELLALKNKKSQVMLEKITKKHWIIFGLLVVLLLPIISFQPSGTAIAGFTGGFVLPLEYFFHVIFFLTIGIVSVWLGGQAMLALPLAVVSMLLIGAASDVSMLQVNASRSLLFATVLAYGIAMSVGYSKRFLPVVTVASALSFYIGAVYVLKLPDLASMEYFMFGSVGCAVALMACGASLSLAGLGYWRKLGDKLREVPAMASFMSFF